MHDWRSVAALYAALLLNAGLFHEIGIWKKGSGEPWALGLMLAGVAGLLIWGAFLPSVAAETSFDSRLAARFGRWPAFIIYRLLLPAWAVSWFAAQAKAAVTCLDGLFPGAPIAWVAITALHPLQTAPFLMKVSLAAAIGLLLSTWPWLPAEWSRATEWPMAPGAPATYLLLWIVPALLLAGHWRTKQPRKVAVYGVAIPLVFSASFALITMLGAAGHSVGMSKLPLYLRYAGLRGQHEGWVKLLVLSFTLLAAARFAVWTGSLVSNWPRIAVTLLFGIATWLGLGSWGHSPAWLVTALPFAPLAAVLVVRSPISPMAGTAAWLTGWLIAWLPLASQDISAWLGDEGRQLPAVLTGSLTAFALAHLASRWQRAGKMRVDEVPSQPL